MYGCIYKLENIVTNEKYIGKTTQKPYKRKASHLSKLSKNEHYNEHLQFSFNKHGRSAFKFSILIRVNSEKELNWMESYFIEKYHTLNPNYGFNIVTAGENPKYPIYVRKKMSESMKREKNPMYKRFGKKNHMYGRTGRNSPGYRSGKKNAQFNKQTGKYRGTSYVIKSVQPWNKVWRTVISYNGYRTLLGHFNDPISGEIVFNFVFNEIWEIPRDG